MKPVAPPARTDLQGPDAAAADSDERLMERFCSGEEAAFDELFQRYALTLHRFLVRMTGNVAAADDLTQTAFLSVVRARGRFRKGAAFRPWLYAIAANAARDRNRRRREEPTSDDDLAATEESSDARHRDSILERTVRRALSQLPEGHRAAIVLHQFEGLSFVEVAEALDIPVGTAKIHAHRGYERLRELLREVWEEE